MISLIKNKESEGVARKILLILMLIVHMACSDALAQTLKVVSAEANPEDLSASTNCVVDKKGRPCALLRVYVPSIKDMTFSEEVISSNYESGEYSVYVPAKTKAISLFHPNYLPLKLHLKDLGLQLEPKSVYSIKISPEDNVNSILELKSKKAQYVSIHVSPSKADVIINGEKLHSKRGQISKLLPLGNYKYEVSSPDYHSQEGLFSLEKKEGLVAFDVKLIPMFGWLKIDCAKESDSADVWIDGKSIGVLPIWRTDRLPSGIHELKISKPFYKSYASSFEISDAKTNELNIELQRNFSWVSIQQPSDVEIWINDTLCGKGKWNGRMIAGDYKIESRKHLCLPGRKDLSISVVPEIVDIDLPEPKKAIDRMELTKYYMLDGKSHKTSFQIDWPIDYIFEDVDSLRELIIFNLFNTVSNDLNVGAKSAFANPRIKLIQDGAVDDIMPADETEYTVDFMAVKDNILSFMCSKVTTADDLITYSDYRFVNYDVSENRQIRMDEIFTNMSILKNVIGTSDEIADVGFTDTEMIVSVKRLQTMEIQKIPIEKVRDAMTSFAQKHIKPLVRL